ncbi:c-type cytochrome [Variovorax sp. J22R133]|uniref:c-type cytochrome n=1 Tax=Variovorax brevis TaxID=3053503 RepID=UPI0025750D05|nr:c-type cytochrome [Variovorax sp. J22R133]MDM0111425.1 c-type cytochrome [Variovorax sp. J22R133]
MTTNDAPGALRDRRFAVWTATIIVLFLAAGTVGFVWLPAADAGRSAPALWDAICSAIGLPARNAPAPAAQVREPASQVAWTASTRQLLAEGNAAKGATLAAATCANCHGPAGITDDAIFPNLAGQSRAAIYKQLQDFKTSRRSASVMGVYVAPLNDADLRDLAAHYASLPAPPSRATTTPPDAVARRLVESGDPMRGIAACAACHGPMGWTEAAPTLQGQQRAYLEVQLQALASGSRHNDINEQMRSVARRLTAQEISALAQHYSKAPPGDGRKP